MKNIEINLGKDCNNHCKFCMSADAEAAALKFIEIAELKKELKKYKSQGYDSLGFLGGEVTLYNGLIPVVKYSKKIGFSKIHLVTNGRLLCDNKFLQDLIKAGITRFSVSIHSHIESVEDDLTQVKGSFSQKLRGLKNLINYKKSGDIKSNISINLVINKKNYNVIDKTILFFNKMGINDFRLNFIWPKGNTINYYDEILLTYDDFLP